MNDCFGIPRFYFYNDKNTISEEVYVTEKEVIRAYFVQDKLEGYFITKVKNNTWHQIGLPDIYRNLTNSKCIGKFSFYDVKESPKQIVSYVTNGFNKLFYDSEYRDTEMEKAEYDNFSKKYFVDRKKSYPNTYGICTPQYSDEIFEMASNYYEYDWDL